MQGQSRSRCKLSSWEGSCLLEKLKSREFILIGDGDHHLLFKRRSTIQEAMEKDKSLLLEWKGKGGLTSQRHSHCPRGHRSEIKVSTRARSFQSTFFLFQLWGTRALLGLWLHCSNLCLCHHMASPLLSPWHLLSVSGFRAPRRTQNYLVSRALT